jgi:phospholipase/carboxylesterase
VLPAADAFDGPADDALLPSPVGVECEQENTKKDASGSGNAHGHAALFKPCMCIRHFLADTCREKTESSLPNQGLEKSGLEKWARDGKNGHMKSVRVGPLLAHFAGGDDGSGGGNGPAVVLCHGFGAPGTDLVTLSEELSAPRGTRFIFPEAPFTLDGPPVPPEYVGRAWWEIDMMALQLALMSGELATLATRVPDGLREARETLLAFLDALASEERVESRRLVLGGFSQGAMLTCDFMLRDLRPLAGLVLLSGSMIAEAEWRPLMASRAGLSVFQSHGRQDPILPFELAGRLHRELEAAGLRGPFVTFNGGHGIHPVVLAALGEFLRDVLDGSGA